MAVELGWHGFRRLQRGGGARHSRRTTWPGNVRELKNVVESARSTAGATLRMPVGQIVFDAFDSPWRPGDASAVAAVLPLRTDTAIGSAANDGRWRRSTDHSSVADLRVAVANYERDILAAALAKCRHNQRATATALALTYDQLRHALKRHNML